MSLPEMPLAPPQDVIYDLGNLGTFWIVTLAWVVIQVVSMWRIFEKAGRPGWAAIVPIYNVIVLIQVAGKPGWWCLLMLIPLVNVIVWIIVSIQLAENFGHSALFGIGLLLLGFIFYPILAFGDARYGAGT